MRLLFEVAIQLELSTSQASVLEPKSKSGTSGLGEDSWKSIRMGFAAR